MFEQSLVLDQGPARNGWTLMASLTGQTAAVGIALLIPLIYTQTLPPAQIAWARILPPTAPTPPPPPDARLGQTVAHTQRVFQQSALVAPSRHINPVLDNVIDDPAPYLPLSPNSADSGPIGSIPNLGVLPVIDAKPPAIKVEPPPRKPEVATAKIPRISIGGVVQEAKILKRVLPVYPPLARQARIQGTVVLMGVIARDGTIQNLQVMSGHPLLIASALDAVRQWVYRPTYLNGEPVEVNAPIEVRFTLSQ